MIYDKEWESRKREKSKKDIIGDVFVTGSCKKLHTKLSNHISALEMLTPNPSWDFKEADILYFLIVMYTKTVFLYFLWIAQSIQ